MPETSNNKVFLAPGTRVDKNFTDEFVMTVMLSEMLQLQEGMFKTLLVSLLTNVNSPLDAVVGTVADLKVYSQIFSERYTRS